MDMPKHPGFNAVREGIQRKGGYTKEQAAAILANASRKASKKAKKKNPRLNKIKGE